MSFNKGSWLKCFFYFYILFSIEIFRACLFNTTSVEFQIKVSGEVREKDSGKIQRNELSLIWNMAEFIPKTLSLLFQIESHLVTLWCHQVQTFSVETLNSKLQGAILWEIKVTNNIFQGEWVSYILRLEKVSTQIFPKLFGNWTIKK